MAQIDWARMPNQPAFDRVVEAFFVNENADLPKDAYAVNGRGGDGGTDLHIRRDGKLIVVQFKFFPEGFSGGWADTRRKQISKSFKSALVHEPDQWWLVVPTTLTPGERKYVVGLPARQRPKRTKPEVVIFDRPRLDTLASKHPDLVTYFKRDELLEAAKVFNQETALMVHADDLTARMRALTAQGDTLDPDWRMDVFTDGPTVGSVLVAKNPHAAERSPITINMTATFGPDQLELRDRFVRLTAWGTPGRVDLPAAVVGRLVVEGPAVLSHSTDEADVSLIPIPQTDGRQPCTLVFLRDGRRSASFQGETTWMGTATVGSSVRVQFHGVVALEFLLPHDRTEPASANITVSFRGCEPVHALRGIALLELFESGDAIALEVDDVEVARLFPKEGAPSPLAQMGGLADGMDAFKQYLGDLEVAQSRTSNYFPIPATVSSEDRINLRCIRLLLDGKCIVLPGFRDLNQTLNGDDDDDLRALLTGGPRSVAVEIPNLWIDALGRTFDLGPGRLYAPEVEVVDPGHLLRRLDAGDADGEPLILRAKDGFGIWAFLQSAPRPGDDVIRPVGLGLDGVPDAPDVARAREPEPSHDTSHELGAT